MDQDQNNNSEVENTSSIESVEKNPIETPIAQSSHKSTYLIAGSIISGCLILAAAYVYTAQTTTINSGVSIEDPAAIEESVPVQTTEVSTSSLGTIQQPSTTAELISAQIPEDSKVRYEYDRFSYIDDSGEYTVYKAMNLDPETFVYINEDYVKDKERLYYRGNEVYGFNPTSCTPENVLGCRHDKWRDTINPYNLDIQWYDSLVDASSILPTDQNACITEGYQAGLVANGPLASSPIYIQSEEVCGMWCGGHYERKGIYHIVFEGDYIRVEDEGFTISGIDDFPEKITIPGSNLHLLTLGPAGFASPEDTQVRFLFADPQVGSIFDSGRGNYHSVRDDHMRMEYELEFPFWREEDSKILDITFDDGTKNQEEYSLNGGYGEGFRIEDDPGIENRLVREGQFSNDHPVYSLVNSNDYLLQELYNNKNTLASYQNGSNKYNYDEFISHRPLLYWKNPFGDWVELLNRRYETAAEKCKPVIYLYPEETGEFEVYVEPNGGFTETIPEYGNGWEVVSTPDSQITDKKTGEVYPYLYWEGINTGIPEITEGWVVDVSNVEEFLKNKLSILGMNDKEIADFNEYWVDRLQAEGAAHYKIMFLPQAYFDELSPLTVQGDETPASIIRVMMYAQPAESGEVLPEQVLPATPVRQGFTVVEWGGALLN